MGLSQLTMTLKIMDSNWHIAYHHTGKRPPAVAEGKAVNSATAIFPLGLLLGSVRGTV